MNCANCVFANKAKNKDYVYCRYWQQKANESGKTPENFIRGVIFDEEPNINEVGLGWGFPLQHYTLETHWVHKGTASEGLMYADQICISKDDSCSKFKEVGE